MHLNREAWYIRDSNSTLFVGMMIFNGLDNLNCNLSPNQFRAPAHWGLGEIDGLLVPPGKASNLLTNHLITG